MTTDYPVLVGVGQVVNRPEQPREPKPPLDLMIDASRAAEQDAGVSGLLSRVDSVRAVNIMSWPSADPPSDLAAAVGAPEGERCYSVIGGNTPQWLVNETAEAIVRGDVRLALIAGAEAVYSVRQASKAGGLPPWGEFGRPRTNLGERRRGFSDVEQPYGGHLPIRVYPLFENAIRARAGRSIEEHQRALGELCARLAAAASENPYAWFRDAKPAQEIATPGPDNRMVCFPYPKYMNAILDVDQGAALLLTKESVARELDVSEERWVYLHGCADANDHWYFSERVNYHESPAIRVAGRRALSMAGLSADDIAYFDLYSCFPSAVQYGRDALGIAPDDPRPLSITGGLPYFGGPGNNYVTHAIAAMAQTLRADREAYGLVSGLGWYSTKHAIGVYGARRPSRDWQRTDPAVDQTEIDAMPDPEVVEQADGVATVETYTVAHDRAGAPEQGIVVGRLEDGRRFLAVTPPDAEVSLLESMMTQEFVGARGRVRHDAASSLNVFTP